MLSNLFLQIYHNNKVRHLLRILIAVIIATIVHYFFSFTNEGWIIIAAAFVMLTSLGSALYQGLLRFFLLAGLVVCISLLMSSVSTVMLRLNDVAIGAFIGIVINILILPDRADIEFRKVLIPLLKICDQYFSGIIQLLLKNDDLPAENANIAMEKELQRMPAWVYEAGFDIRMQKGHRYFFMKISQMSDILFALHYLAHHPFSENLLEETHNLFLNCVTKVNQLITAFMSVLDLKKLQEGVEDFGEEILLIEQAFHREKPFALGLLDIEKEVIYFAELIAALKDLRNTLVNLAKTLR